MAPEIPIATYSLQALAVLPDWPTCRLFGSQPASAIGREQPRVAPTAVASSWKRSTFACSPMPRPIERMNSAVVISTSSAELTSMKLRLLTRVRAAGAGKLVTVGDETPSGGLNVLARN